MFTKLIKPNLPLSFLFCLTRLYPVAKTLAIPGKLNEFFAFNKATTQTDGNVANKADRIFGLLTLDISILVLISITTLASTYVKFKLFIKIFIEIVRD